jgi:hypothetical protein
VCGGLFVAALAPRVTYLLVSHSTFDGYYWRVADSLLTNGSLSIDGVATAQYEPLYPLFLAAGRFVAGDHLQLIRTLQAAIDSLGAVWLFLLTDALTGRRRAALLSALLFACYPLLVRHSVVVGEFALLSTLLIAFAYTASRATTAARAAMAGVWLGLAILTRAGVAPLLLLTFGVFLIEGRPRAALALAIVASAIVSPWLVRNHRLNGSVWPTRSGLNLFIGNSEYSAAMLPAHSPDLLLPYANAAVAREQPPDAQWILRRFNLEHAASAAGWQPPALLASTPAEEKAIDARLTRMAFAHIKAHPVQILWLKLKNVAYFFWPRLVPSRVALPETEVVLEANGLVRVENSPARPVHEELAYTLPYLLVIAAALRGIWIRRRRLRQDVVLWCIVLTFVATHALYFPATRYRVPMEFVLLFYAAVGLDSRVTRAGSAT